MASNKRFDEMTEKATIANTDILLIADYADLDINSNPKTKKLTWANMLTIIAASGFVLDVDYDAYSILASDADDTPVALTVAASTFVGRKTSGGISAMTASEARDVLSVEENSTADQTDSEIETAYNNQVAQVSETEKDEMTSTSIKTSAPKDIADIAGTGNNIVTDSTTSRTFSLTDSNKHIRCTNGSAITLTVPLNATVPLPIGFMCEPEQAGAGTITYSPEGAAVLRSKDSNLSSNGQYGSSMIKKIGTDEWLIVGDLA